MYCSLINNNHRGKIAPTDSIWFDSRYDRSRLNIGKVDDRRLLTRDL